MRELVLGAVDGLVEDFLYYDRKEDEDLPAGAIDHHHRLHLRQKITK